MKPLLLSMIAALALGSAAAAQDVTLSAKLEAGTLHAGDVDMVAYRTDLENGAYEVTAYFRARNSWAQPERVMLQLQDSDAVTFAMPSEPRMLYTFSRTADVVQISANYVPVEMISY